MSRRLQQVERPNNICLDKIPRPGNRSIHVRLSREMQDVCNPVLPAYAPHRSFISQPPFQKHVLGVLHTRLEMARMPGIIKTIEFTHPFVWGRFYDVMDKFQPKNPAPACDK